MLNIFVIGNTHLKYWSLASSIHLPLHALCKVLKSYDEQPDSDNDLQTGDLRIVE